MSSKALRRSSAQLVMPSEAKEMRGLTQLDLQFISLIEIILHVRGERRPHRIEGSIDGVGK